MALNLVSTVAAPRSNVRQPMTTEIWSTIPQAVRSWSRRRDKRTQFSSFLAGLVAGLHRPRATDGWAVFEQALQRLVPTAVLALRQARHNIGPDTAERPGLLVVDIPGPGGSKCDLEIRLDPTGPQDDWTRHILEDAARIAAIILSFERPPLRGWASSAGALREPALLVGSSPAMRQLRENIAKLAATDFTVLIEGESGSGKELVARQLHEFSSRQRGPFVAVNCAALVETLLEAELFGIEERTATGVRGRRGKFELAAGGTLFLDEVGDLSTTGQAKVLRAIQELAVERVGGHARRVVDTRIVAATNRNLRDLVTHGRFRPDLYYRLSGVDVQVPALRHRRQDVSELARHFLARYQPGATLTTAALDVLTAYDWPGNVRELERVIERAVALATSPRIDVEDLPLAMSVDYSQVVAPSLTRNDSLRAWASRYVRLVLERSEHNKRRACRTLGISYHTLQAYLDYHASASELAASPEEEPDARMDPAG